MILYDFLFSGNAYKVRLLLSLLQRKYEYRAVDLLKGETRQPWFLDKNPVGQVPVLELPNGTCIRESSVILQVLAQDTAFFPQNEMLKIQVQQWLCFEQSNIDQVIARARFRKTFPDAVPTRPEEFIPWYRQGNRALAVMEEHLKGKEFFVGENCTIADIALYAYTHKAEVGGFDLLPYPEIRQWFTRIEALPNYLRIDALPK